MAADPVDSLFTAFLRDLAIAWRALAAYPTGHPSAVAGLAKGIESLARLLEETGPVELVPTRGGLLCGERRYDSATAQRLAELLRRRGTAAVAIDPGVEPRELETLLRALALDSLRVRTAGSLAAELAAAGLVHLRTRDIDFSAVALVDGEAEPESAEYGALWERLVRRVLSSGTLPGDALAAWLATGQSALELLRALLGEGTSGPFADQPWAAKAVAAALVAAAHDYAESPTEERARVLAQLLQKLPLDHRDGLSRALVSALAPRPDFRSALAPLLVALPAADADRLRRAIEGIRAHDGERARKLDPERLARLRRAFAAADLDAFLDDRPPERSLDVVLELPQGPVTVPLTLGAAEVARELAPGAIDRTATQALLELAERPEVSPEQLPAVLHRLELGYRRLLAGGRFHQALELVERVQRRAGREGPAEQPFRRCAERLAGRESVAALVAALPEISEEALVQVRALLERLGANATRHLLGVLAEADDRALRHRLLGLLATLGPMVVRDATHLLADPRWYVVRNMLLLLRRVGDPGSVPAVRRCAEHGDLRVRLEAIRNLFAFDQDVPRELLRKALQHPDPRLAEEAIELAGENGLLEAVEPLAALVAARDLWGRRRATRLKAIRALGSIGDPSALERLGRFAARFAFPPVAVEERIALYQTLESYPEEARGPWIVRGRRSRIPEVRAIAERLARAATEQRA